MDEPASGPGEAALLAAFIKDLARYPILTRAEESALIVRAVSGDKHAEDRLVGSSLRFVIKLALGYWRTVSFRYPGLSPLDMIQEGSIRLVRAVRKLDPSSGYRVLTYAGPAIKHGIARAIIDCRRHQCESLDAAISEDSEETFLDRLPAEDEGSDVRAFHAGLLDLVKKLRAREKKVIEERFLEDKTLNEVAGMLRITKERVRGIETRALFRLRWAVERGESFLDEGQRRRA